MNKADKTLSIIAAVLLFVALLHLPYGYYTFMRIAVTGIAGYLIYAESQKGHILWLVFYIASAIIFNPIIPIYLRHKQSWMPIDIIFGLIFLLSLLKKSNHV
jgi:hypothetical protein